MKTFERRPERPRRVTYWTSAAEATEMLQVSAKTLDNMVRRRILVRYQVGNREPMFERRAILALRTALPSVRRSWDC